MIKSLVETQQRMTTNLYGARLPEKRSETKSDGKPEV